jgi:hypothetical protein
MEDWDELTFMVGGEDENGDGHLFVTSSIERAIAEFERILPIYKNVRGNPGFEDIIRPLVEAKGRRPS